MNWKGILGWIISILYTMSTIYQLVNWDDDYWELSKNIIFLLLGLSMVMESRKNRADETSTEEDTKPKDHWKQYQKPKNEDD